MRTGNAEMENMKVLDLFKDFTPEDIKALKATLGDPSSSKARERMSKSAKARWSKVSEEEKQAYLKRSFLSPEAKEKSTESGRRYWASRTPEQIEEHIRKSFLSPEAIKASGRGYSRFIANLSEEDREAFSRKRIEKIREFWASPRGNLTRRGKEAFNKKRIENCAFCDDYACELLKNAFNFMCEVLEMGTNGIPEAKKNLDAIRKNR